MISAVQDKFFLSKSVAGKLIKGDVDPTQNMKQNSRSLFILFFAESDMIEMYLLRHAENDNNHNDHCSL